jgi:hypothetical protein
MRSAWLIDSVAGNGGDVDVQASGASFLFHSLRNMARTA